MCMLIVSLTSSCDAVDENRWKEGLSTCWLGCSSPEVLCGEEAWSLAFKWSSWSPVSLISRHQRCLALGWRGKRAPLRSSYYSVMFMQKVLLNFIIFIFLFCETSCKVFLQRHEQFGVDFGTPTSSSTFRYSPTRTSIKHIRRVGRLRSVQAAARRFIYSTSFVIRRADLTSVDSK